MSRCWRVSSLSAVTLKTFNTQRRHDTPHTHVKLSVRNVSCHFKFQLSCYTFIICQIQPNFSYLVILLLFVRYSQADVYPSRRVFLRSTLVRWCGSAMGRVLYFAISRSRVQILLQATLRNNPGQVVYTNVPLSPSSITWYRPKGSDALWLGR